MPLQKDPLINMALSKKEDIVQNIKEFKKGEIIFKEGAQTSNIYIVQSGRLSLFIERNGKKIHIDEIKASQVAGEEGALGASKYLFSAETLAPTKVLEIPVKVIQAQNETAAPGLKILMKSLNECLKQTRGIVKNVRLEQDNSPCPQMFVPKIFSLMVLLGNHVGKKDEGGSLTISWQALKLYSSRIFSESPQRMLHALDLLKKLGYVELSMRVNEDEEDELADIKFLDIQTVEDFTEFYQFHLFKPGRSEAIYVDEMAFKIIKSLVAFCYDKEVNHRGAVQLPYDEVLKHVKNTIRLDLKNTHFDLLEKKGLLVQRKSTDDGLLLLFDKDEFIKTAVYWAIIHEIDLWNQKGFIDFTQPKEEHISSSGAGACSECGTEVQAEAKFCQNCGFNLAA